MDAAMNIHTIDDILNLPEEQRAELIDGRIYMMSTPGREHQKVSMELSYKIRKYIEDNNGNCEVYAAPFAVYLNADDSIYVEPDISVICDKEKLDDKGCKGAPDWIIEIVSKSTRNVDYGIKLFKYRSAGVREYWIVDIDKNRVMVWNFEKDITEEYTLQDEIPVGIYKNLKLKLRQP